VIDRRLRDIKEELMAPVASATGDTFHPLTITLVNGALGILCAILASLGLYVPGLILWLLNRFLDGLDGTLARFAGRQSDLGAYLDLMFDFLVYALVPISLVSSHPSTAAMVTLIGMLAMFYLNAASWMILAAILEQRQKGARARGELTGLTLPTGLIEGAETVIFYSVFFLFPGDLHLLFGLFSVLIIVTIFQRIAWAVNHL
jgi:phosphatidylglycerophosphate synthase